MKTLLKQPPGAYYEDAAYASPKKGVCEITRATVSNSTPNKELQAFACFIRRMILSLLLPNRPHNRVRLGPLYQSAGRMSFPKRAIIRIPILVSAVLWVGKPQAAPGLPGVKGEYSNVHCDSEADLEKALEAFREQQESDEDEGEREPSQAAAAKVDNIQEQRDLIRVFMEQHT